MSIHQTRKMMAAMALTLLAFALLVPTAQAKPIGAVGGGITGAQGFRHSLATVAASPLPASTRAPRPGISQPLRAGTAPLAGVRATNTAIPWAGVAGFAGVILIAGMAVGVVRGIGARRPALT
jgi:hypothetical protein